MQPFVDAVCDALVWTDGVLTEQNVIQWAAELVLDASDDSNAAWWRAFVGAFPEHAEGRSIAGAALSCIHGDDEFSDAAPRERQCPCRLEWGDALPNDPFAHGDSSAFPGNNRCACFRDVFLAPMMALTTHAFDFVKATRTTPARCGYSPREFLRLRPGWQRFCAAMRSAGRSNEPPRWQPLTPCELAVRAGVNQFGGVAARAVPAIHVPPRLAVDAFSKAALPLGSVVFMVNRQRRTLLSRESAMRLFVAPNSHAERVRVRGQWAGNHSLRPVCVTSIQARRLVLTR